MMFVEDVSSPFAFSLSVLQFLLLSFKYY